MMSILFFIITSSIMFTLLSHPLSFGCSLLMTSILIALMSGLINTSFWFSYILVLIMVGGMLILFIYMTSIASNEKFKFSNKMIIFMAIMITLWASVYLWTEPMTNELMMIQDLTQYSPSINNSLSKYFNWPAKMMIIILMIYLLITMIMTVNITKLNQGPLRQMF